MCATLTHVDKAIYAVARLSRRAWDARMESAAHHRPSAHHGDGFVGVIYGDIGTTAFRCSVAEAVERNEFVQVQHETCGIVLGRGRERARERALSLPRAASLGGGDQSRVEERVSAEMREIVHRQHRP